MTRPPRRSPLFPSTPFSRCGFSKVPPPVGAFAMTSLLLAQDFPPMGGGIARLHGELARRYPRGELIVSTPQNPDAHEVDAQFGGGGDRLPSGRGFTKTRPRVAGGSRPPA